METYTGLDWISATYKGEQVERWKHYVHPSEYASPLSEHGGMLGYTNGTKFASGAIMLTNEDRQDMGIHVIYSSKAIRQVYEVSGINSIDLLRFMQKRAVISRIDVCIDIMDAELPVSEMYEDCLSRKVETKARSFGLITSSDGMNKGEAKTLYVGSRKRRKKLMRIYDKAKEQGTQRQWWRVELETHKNAAHSTAQYLSSLEDDKVPSAIAGLCDGYCSFNQKAWKDAISDELSKNIPVRHETDANTVKWLLDVVAPTLARECVLNSGLFEEFYRTVAAHISGMKSDEEFYEHSL